MEDELMKKVRKRRRRIVAVLAVVALFAGSTVWAMFSRQAAEEKAAGTEPAQEMAAVREDTPQERTTPTEQDNSEKEKTKKAKTESQKGDKKNEKDAEKRAKAEAAEVDAKIMAIGQVTPKKKTKKKIKAARTAYDDLSEAARNKVVNLEVLVAAEKDYKALKAEEKARKKEEKAAQEKASREQDAQKTVTISIHCSELSNNMDRLEDEGLAKYVPKNGVILGKTKYRFTGKATVYDALKKVCRNHGIPYIQETGSGYAGVYISSINHLAEFDGGKNSGWMYEVNGTMPNITCSQYELQNGDKIRWFYTINYKKE